MYIDNLADTVNKYNSTYHNTIKMKPPDVKLSICIGFNNGNNYEDSTFDVGDHVRISKYESIFAKCYTPSWSEDDFVIATPEINELRAENFAAR